MDENEFHPHVSGSSGSSFDEGQGGHVLGLGHGS